METELVTILSRTPLSAAARSRGRELLDGNVDWVVLRGLAGRWQVEPTVFGNLRSEFAATIPPAVLSDLAVLEQQSRARAISRTLVLMHLVTIFERAGIPVVVLKGPAVAIAAYDDYSRRTFSDVDLLVRRTDLPAARDLLLGRGFSREYSPEIESALIRDQHALELADARIKVELHWSLLSRYLRFDIDVDDLWKRAHRVECMGAPMSVLATEHLFLYLCAHGAKHEWSVFRWICDVAQLTQRLSGADAKKVLGLAERHNAKRILSLALRIAHETFGDEESPFPPGAWLKEVDTRELVALVKTRIESDGSATHGLLPPRVSRIHPYLGPLAFWIHSRERARDRVACALHFLFLPAASEAGRGTLYGMLRPVRLATRALRRIIRAQ
jgi:hypothetical protein